MEVFENMENAILSINTTRLIAYSDAKGTFMRTLGRDVPPDRALAEDLDILSSAAVELGQRRASGRFRSAVLSYSDATVLVGSCSPDCLVYILTDPDLTQLGLLLSHMRNLLSSIDPAEIGR